MDTTRAPATDETTTTPQVELTEIGQVAINVRNLERAVTFYRDTLGMRFLFQAPGGLAFFDVGGVRLMLGVPERPELDHPASVLYYRVSDIAASYNALTNRGVVFLDEPHLIARMPTHELWMTFFRDSEDNVLALMEERES